MYIFYLFLLINCGKGTFGISNKISQEVDNYFRDENIRSFHEKWEVHRASVENSLELAIKETFGKAGLNVYIKSVDDTHKVSDGFLINDKVVNVLFRDMHLTQYPYLRNPRVWFPLASNVLRVQTSVSKMFIDSSYLLFRSFNDVVYPSNKEEEEVSSPFARQQVQTKGQATIIAEYCNLFGDAVATLQGESVNLGYENFELTNCKFSIEISTPGLGSPPLIVPYFSNEQGVQLERLLMTTLRTELMVKLQAAVHSCVNPTLALGSLLPEVRKLQRRIFRNVNDYETEVIRNLNKLTTEKNIASEEWRNYRITWQDKINQKVESYIVSLTNMTISGLDSAYNGHTGGPVKTDVVNIYEDLRYSGIQIRGLGFIRMDEFEQNFMFSGEIQDVICKGTMQVGTTDENISEPIKLKTNDSTDNSIAMSSWRNLIISGPTFPSLDTYSFITGVLLNRLPVIINKHLSKNFENAIQYTETPYDIQPSQLNTDDDMGSAGEQDLSEENISSSGIEAKDSPQEIISENDNALDPRAIREDMKRPDVIEWVPATPATAMNYSQRAFVAGEEDGSPLWCIRGYAEGELCTGKLAIKSHIASIGFSYKEYLIEIFEILLAKPTSVYWLPDSNGRAPFKAIPAGKTLRGVILYICRVTHEDFLIPGKLNPNDGYCYIPFRHKELSFKKYEVLCGIAN
ncbi:unnamed protein product [Chilo suppressalis]|uniref:Uncharacterized protein n=1 Tax=Chilo suppressalis TaxID=168631 RepID=A0ABN8AZ67_CHISP|nr:unnamed protein product [Chilo suppressalis]